MVQRFRPSSWYSRTATRLWRPLSVRLSAGSAEHHWRCDPVSRVIEPHCCGLSHERCGCQRQAEGHRRRCDPQMLSLVGCEWGHVFMIRADASGAGSSMLKDPETVLYTVHSSRLSNLWCAMDRWYDNRRTSLVSREVQRVCPSSTSLCSAPDATSGRVEGRHWLRRQAVSDCSRSVRQHGFGSSFGFPPLSAVTFSCRIHVFFAVVSS